jgi:SNF2 family DNA or RNA helicase
VRPVAVLKSDETEAQVREFATNQTRPVLIVSYESYRKLSETINATKGVDLLICDEGHRLKSATGNKTIESLARAPTKRRIILTGTPLQNQLDEFFSLVNFVNPGALGTDAKHFKRVFQAPIERGRDKNAAREESRLAEARSSELLALTSGFVLRRTSELNAKNLPPKFETTVFIKLAEKQTEEYERFTQTETREILKEQNVNGQDALRLIAKLKHICICSNSNDSVAISNIPLVSRSSKLRFVLLLVREALACGDKLVLVSNFTSTLDLLGTLLRDEARVCRLDGTQTDCACSIQIGIPP